MNRTLFRVSRMDCPAEEQLIRMKLLGDEDISQLLFDIPARLLEVIHRGNIGPTKNSLDQLNLGTVQVGETETYIPPEGTTPPDEHAERRLLNWVFTINFSFFILELFTGLHAHSMGLIADSLDMLADALIFALSLYVVGKSVKSKKTIAGFSGYLQLVLACYGIIEVIWRFAGKEHTPDFATMIVISSIALAGNMGTLILLKKANNNEIHIKASTIFISNDVLVNLGVMVAGLLVYLTHSRYPDLIIGIVVFFLVGRGAFSILKL